MSKAKVTRHVVPSIEEVAGIIRDTWKWEYWTAKADKDAGLIDGDCTDVRLVVGRRGTSWFGHWAVSTGLSDYDQWHGLCGASSYDATERPTMKVAREIARDVIAQVREQIADDTE